MSLATGPLIYISSVGVSSSSSSSYFFFFPFVLFPIPAISAGFPFLEPLLGSFLKLICWVVGGYPAATELAILEEVIARCGQKVSNGLEIHDLLYSDLGAQVPLHISLSRPVVLVTEDRQPFRDLLNDAIRESNIRP